MNTFKAKIIGTPSKVMTKSNGAEYVLINAEILEGPAKGKVVASTRTIKNAEGLEKSIPEVNTEVSLWHTALESSSNPGKFVHFFEIQTGATQATNDELSALLGVPQLASQKL